MKKQVIFDDCCPRCGSGNIDFIDSNYESTKYICRNCGEDFIVDDDDQTVADRHNRPIMRDEE